MNNKNNNFIINLNLKDKFSTFSSSNKLKTAIINKGTAEILLCSDDEFRSYLQTGNILKELNFLHNTTKFSINDNQLTGIIPLNKDFDLSFINSLTNHYNENIETKNIKDLLNILPEDEAYLLKSNIEYLINLSKLVIPPSINKPDPIFDTISEDLLPLAITWFDLHGNVLKSNNISANTFGYSREEMQTKNVYDFCKDITKEEWDAAVDTLKRSGYFKAEKVITRKNGDLLPVQAFLTYQNEKNLKYILCYLFDNTLFSPTEYTFNNEFKTLNKNLQEANLYIEDAKQNKERFLSTVSHELRTPLNSIIGFNKLLTLEYYGKLNEDQKKYLEIIENSSHELLELVNDLLSYTSIQSGEMELEAERFNISELLHDTVAITEKRFQTEEISFNYIDLTNKENLQSDKNKIKRVLFNLLSNALKFTDKGGCVDLIAEIMDEKLIVTVIDTGIGIPEEDQKNIFKMFYKTNQAFEKVTRGTGIGLAISKKLIEMLGGTISVNSEIGKGSKFWFEIPVNINP